MLSSAPVKIRFLSKQLHGAPKNLLLCYFAINQTFHCACYITLHDVSFLQRFLGGKFHSILLAIFAHKSKKGSCTNCKIA